MLFNSFEFVVFLPLVFGTYRFVFKSGGYVKRKKIYGPKGDTRCILECY